eukprot:scaffold7179_cov81-Isochrysis_galbana.AAC.2
MLAEVPELEGSLEEALARAPALLQHTATQAAATRALLGRLPCEEPRGARAIALQLCAHGERSQEVRPPADRGRRTPTGGSWPAARRNTCHMHPFGRPAHRAPRPDPHGRLGCHRASSGERGDLLPSSGARGGLLP